MDVAIVGAGWYGCAIGDALLERGHRVTVFDAAAEPLSQTSGNNQFRLHLGFHYPRSHATREQSMTGFRRFVERYPDLTAPVPNNVYAVVRNRSLLDYGTYLAVLRQAGLAFEERPPSEFGIRGVEGCVLCGERRILTARARGRFQRIFGARLVMNHRVESVVDRGDAVHLDGASFDVLINCTNCAFLASRRWPVRYEPCVTFHYESACDAAFTFVDGPFLTIYPASDSTVSAYSVRKSRLGAFDDGQDALRRMNDISRSELSALQRAMEADVAELLTEFPFDRRSARPSLSMRSMIVSGCDDRTYRVWRDGRIMHVLPGKIDAVIDAADHVAACLEAEASTGTDRRLSPEAFAECGSSAAPLPLA